MSYADRTCKNKKAVKTPKPGIKEDVKSIEAAERLEEEDFFDNDNLMATKTQELKMIKKSLLP